MDTPDEKHVVHQLRDALNGVIDKADDWARAVRMYDDLIPLPRDASDVLKQREDRRYEEMRKTRKLLIEAVDEARNAVPDVDHYVRQVHNTGPGAWSTDRNQSRTGKPAGFARGGVYRPGPTDALRRRLRMTSNPPMANRLIVAGLPSAALPD